MDMSEFFSRLVWVDYLAVIAALWGCYVGYKAGFFPELLRIAAYLVTVLVTFNFYEPLAQILTPRACAPDTNSGEGRSFWTNSGSPPNIRSTRSRS